VDCACFINTQVDSCGLDRAHTPTRCVEVKHAPSCEEIERGYQDLGVFARCYERPECTCYENFEESVVNCWEAGSASYGCCLDQATNRREACEAGC
jgi:hypothetical protein